jgi:hypothetical protein
MTGKAVEPIEDASPEVTYNEGLLNTEGPPRTDHHHTGHYATQQEEEIHNVQTLRRAIFTSLPFFMGYAGVICLQHHVKNRLGIKDSNHHMSEMYSAGVGMIYVGNLLFRLLHNIVFSMLMPRYRVCLAYLLMASAHLTTFIVYYVCDSKDVSWVFVTSLVSGIAIGTFESNLMSCLTPLGHGTKSWAVLGVSAGFNLVSVGFFILFAIFPDNTNIEGGSYLVIGGANLLGVVFFLCGIPFIKFDASNDNVKKFFVDAKSIKIWFPAIWKHCLALMIDMFCVSLFTSIVYYIFDIDNIPLWPKSDITMPKNAFYAITNTCSFLGDFTSRKIAYMTKPRNPLFFLVLSGVGAAMMLSKTAIVAPIGIFAIMFANGSVYAHTTRLIDNDVDDRYNLIALSFWLFIGDIGSVVGSQLVAPIKSPLGPVNTHAPGPTVLPPPTTHASSRARPLLW